MGSRGLSGAVDRHGNLPISDIRSRRWGDVSQRSEFNEASRVLGAAGKGSVIVSLSSFAESRAEMFWIWGLKSLDGPLKTCQDSFFLCFGCRHRNAWNLGGFFFSISLLYMHHIVSFFFFHHVVFSFRSFVEAQTNALSRNRNVPPPRESKSVSRYFRLERGGEHTTTERRRVGRNWLMLYSGWTRRNGNEISDLPFSSSCSFFTP